MATPPLASADRSDGGAPPPLQHARGLAHLAFGSFSRASDFGAARHLALLPADVLDLDLSDPAQRQFGDYELLEHIGEGGMGVVYRARQGSLDREVAVKLLSAGPWASKDFIARFEREARNAARMHHPNIVTIHEVGSSEGLHYFSMRLVRGESLSAKLHRGERLPPKAAAALMRTIAEAVDYAHKLGVLHLDLKPANVLLDEAGTPYVADFGLARRLENTLAVENDEISGTPAYMAPEQAQVRASKLTRATDIWGLGAILYELLTNEPPFRGATAQDTVQLVLEGQVRTPRRSQPDLPLDLEAIVLRCLCRDARERYPSARALADDLARFVEGRPVQARPLNGMQRLVRWTRREPKLAASIAGAVAVLIVGLIATGWQWHRARANAAIAMQRLWDSRDDAALRYVDAADGWKAAPLLLANLAEMQASGNLTRAQNARKRLGIIENANPKLIDALPTPAGANVLAISPDARRLAVTPADTVDLRLFDLASGKALWNLADSSHQVDDLQFDTRGGSILMNNPTVNAFAPYPRGVGWWRVDARTGKWLPPPQGFAGDESDKTEPPGVGYTPDARLAVGDVGDALISFWRTDPWQVITPPRLLLKFIELIAPDGRSFATRPPNGTEIQLYSTSTMKRTWSLAAPGFGMTSAWTFSPDSRWLALGDSSGTIWVADCIRHTLRRLSPQASAGVRALSFSEDGAWLAAATGTGGVYLWTWPEGRLLVSPFGQDMQPMRVELDHQHGRVLASGSRGVSGMWDIPETAFEMDRGDALPLGDRLATITEGSSLGAWTIEGGAVAWQPAHDLLANIAARRVQLERLPPPTLKHAHAAPIPAATLRFDGRRLVSVFGKQVRIVDAMTERPLRTFVLSQPAGFAQLSTDGRILVATAGRHLYAWDAASGHPLFQPVALKDSPQHVEVAPDGARVAVGWMEHDDRQGILEAVELRDLHSGKQVAGPLRLRGPQGGLQFNDDGTRLAAWSAVRLGLFDGRTLRAVAGLGDVHIAAHGLIEEGALQQVAFDRTGGLWLLVERQKQNLSYSEIRRYAPDGALRLIHVATNYQTLLPWQGDSLLVVGERGGLAILKADGTAHELPDVERDSPRAAIAASADGHWLARARRDGVVLFDAAEGMRIATLRTPLPAPDLVFQLAFSPDGDRLLARSLRNRLIVWNLAPDVRPVSHIAREFELRDLPLAAELATGRHEPSDAERASLRARDPGAQPATAENEPAVRELPGGPVPPRDPAAPPDTLDLAPLYDFGLSQVSRATVRTAGDFAWLPAGVQRWLGVDYDVRGGVQLQAPHGISDVAGITFPTQVQAPSPRPLVGAIDMLMLSNGMGTDDDHAPILRLTWQYADGGESSQLVAQDGNQMWWQQRISRLGPHARLATWGYDARMYPLLQRASHVYSVRLINPQPQRRLRGFTFAAAGESGISTVILAATVEPSDPAPPGK